MKAAVLVVRKRKLRREKRKYYWYDRITLTIIGILAIVLMLVSFKN